MCTTIAKKINSSWFLAKTRDPVRWMRWDDEIRLFNTKADKYKKLIIQNPNPNEDGYYGGINEKGVIYISTFVKVAENQISYIRRPYVRLILDAPTAKKAVDIIKSFNPRIGGNMFVADKKECYGIEGVPEKYFIEKITNRAVKTNHFLKLPNRNIGFDSVPGFEKWSLDHQKRAEGLVSQSKSIKDLIVLLKDRQNANTKTAICTTRDEDDCFTHSAMVFDTQNIRVFYCQGNPLENEFIEFNFTNKKPKEIGEFKVKD